MDVALRGHAWLAKRDYDKAIKDFNIVLDRDPEDLLASIGRGKAWSAKGDREKAIKDFGTAIKSVDQFIQPLNDLILKNGDLLKNDDRVRLDAIQKEELKYIVACGYDALAWLFATCSEERIRDANRAIKMATKACELTHWKGSWELSTLAAAHAEAGQFVEAERYQTKALDDPALRGADGDDFRQRLQLYKQKKVFRQNP
jgi:tetratricopeptide (TPR) repeat protein